MGLKGRERKRGETWVWVKPGILQHLEDSRDLEWVASYLGGQSRECSIVKYGGKNILKYNKWEICKYCQEVK